MLPQAPFLPELLIGAHDLKVGWHYAPVIHMLHGRERHLMKSPESVAAGRTPLHLADAAAGTQQMTCAVCAVAQAVEDAFTDTSKMGVRTPGASACPAAWAVVPLPALTPIAHRVRGGLQSSLLLLRNLPASLGKRQPAVAALMTLVQPGARVVMNLCHRCGVSGGHRAVQGAVLGAGRPDSRAQLLPRHGARASYLLHALGPAATALQHPEHRHQLCTAAMHTMGTRQPVAVA